VPLLAARALPPDYHLVLPLGGPSLAQLLHSPLLPPAHSNGGTIHEQKLQHQAQEEDARPGVGGATAQEGPEARWRAVLEAGRALAGALASAHSAGIVHRYCALEGCACCAHARTRACVFEASACVQVCVCFLADRVCGLAQGRVLVLWAQAGRLSALSAAS